MRTNIYKDKIKKLLKKEHLLSISDIHQRIPDANYSTVYRNVDQLTDEGNIKKVVFDKDKIMYEINNTDNQHDHFICTGCGFVDELKERSFIDLMFFKKHSVTDVIVKGLCQNCN